MIEIGLIIAICLAVGKWLKTSDFFPNFAIPAAVVVLAIVLNLANAFLYGDGDSLEAGKMALIEALAAIGIHSGVKNTIQSRDS